MASLFASRKKPRRVGREPDVPSSQDNDEDTGPVVRRPASSASRPKSKLRVSFNPEEVEPSSTTTPQEQSSESDSGSRPFKSNRHVASQSLLRHSYTTSTPSHLPLRSTPPPTTDDRPIYNKDYLIELRNSTPSTPKDLSSYNSATEEPDPNVDPDPDHDLDLDLALSTHPDPTSHIRPNHIPTHAEILEKKARRARLAAESSSAPLPSSQPSDDFIPLEAYDSDGEFKPTRLQLSSPHYLSRDARETANAYDDDDESTRLVREDEHLLDGFEEYVEDNIDPSTGRPKRITLLSKAAQREQDRREKEARRQLVLDAEGASDDEASDSSAEARRQYEDGITARVLGQGPAAAAGRSTSAPTVPRPIPRVSDVVKRLRGRVMEMEAAKRGWEMRVVELGKELEGVRDREGYIQGLVREAGERFERLQWEVGGTGGKGDGEPERGLESLGGTPGPS